MFTTEHVFYSTISFHSSAQYFEGFEKLRFCLANAPSTPHAGGLDRVLSIDEPWPRFVLCSGSDGIERATNSRSLELNSSIEEIVC